MRIDSHQHFWAYDPHRESWINDDMKIIRRDFFPEDLKPLLSRNEFNGCIAVEAHDSEKETQFLLDIAAKNYFIKGVVGWLDLTSDKCEERLAYFSRNPLFKGVRHTLQKEDLGFMLKEDFKRGISLLKKYNLTYDLLVLEHQLPETIELVKKFPAQRFVLDHMAKPQISTGLSQVWVQNIQQLAACKNVYCKMSGFLTETKDFEWESNDFIPFLNTVTAAFGENRLMFGSDWPVCLIAGNYEDTVQIVERFFLKRGISVQEKVMGKNAMKFYNL